jgi:hypothetical protein
MAIMEWVLSRGLIKSNDWSVPTKIGGKSATLGQFRASAKITQKSAVSAKTLGGALFSLLLK